MTGAQTTIHGATDPGFESVRDLLEQQFAAGEHIGAGVSVYHRGRKVVDIWGGLADDDTKAPWNADTMAVSYSTTKGLTATCLHVLADRGLVDYAAPVARYWPEFAQNGKDRITVYHLLSHQSGMAGVPEGLYGADLLDWERVIHAIEREAPAWEPGAQSGYHALTFGFLVGEVVRRVSGKTVGAFLRDEICIPLGIADEMYLGAPASVEPRIAKLKNRMVVTPEMIKQYQEAQANPDPLRARAMGMRPDATPGAPVEEWLDTPAGHRAEVPAVGGIMTARALARLYACLANYGELDGVCLLSEATVRRMSERQTYRPDRILVTPIGWALGYMTGRTEGWPYGEGATAFGHVGFGGSLGMCEPEFGMAFGFITNALVMDLSGSSRTASLAATARAACAALD